jgi:hypothetical protein
VSRYADFIARGKARYGDRFSPPPAASRFARYMDSQQRIRVRFSYDEELTGTVSATTGWQPVFLLMRTSRSMGSSNTLGDGDQVVAVQQGRKYIEVQS